MFVKTLQKNMANNLRFLTIVESGRVRDNNYVSWPWTLNVDGQAKYFKTKKEALNFLISNFNKSKNIDVGCMQISTKYHSQEFINISDIIDPEKNVEYAAKYLRQLYNTHKTWNEAVARYHSSVPARKKTYLSKVHYFWKKLRQNSTKKQTKQQKKLDYFKTQLKQEFEIL